MDLSEGRLFFNEVVFVHLPSVHGWLKQHSPKPDATIDVWCGVLGQVSVSEAVSVVYRWTKGELPAPQGYELQDIALHVKAVVMQDRYNSKKHLLVKEIRDNPRVEKNPVLLAPYYARIMANGDRYKAGEISLDECKALNQAIIDEHDKAGRL